MTNAKSSLHLIKHGVTCEGVEVSFHAYLASAEVCLMVQPFHWEHKFSEVVVGLTSESAWTLENRKVLGPCQKQTDQPVSRSLCVAKLIHTRILNVSLCCSRLKAPSFGLLVLPPSCKNMKPTLLGPLYGLNPILLHTDLLINWKLRWSPNLASFDLIPRFTVFLCH